MHASDLTGDARGAAERQLRGRQFQEDDSHVVTCTFQIFHKADVGEPTESGFESETLAVGSEAFEFGQEESSGRNGSESRTKWGEAGPAMIMQSGRSRFNSGILWHAQLS